MTTQPGLASLPYLPDLLRLEWAYHQAQTAANDEETSWEKLQKIQVDVNGVVLSNVITFCSRVVSEKVNFSVIFVFVSVMLAS